ncbi:unnamed protein product [Ilex paraguariensis]|uniref:Uncharacterized protein n=1 Tax=Ilex paraguariensis TaxID=185542 RepID=A0ABC8RH30_9AQUA
MKQNFTICLLLFFFFFPFLFLCSLLTYSVAVIDLKFDIIDYSIWSGAMQAGMIRNVSLWQWEQYEPLHMNIFREDYFFIVASFTNINRMNNNFRSVVNKMCYMCMHGEHVDGKDLTPNILQYEQLICVSFLNEPNTNQLNLL